MRKARAPLARALVKMTGAREPVLSPSLLLAPAEAVQTEFQKKRGQKGIPVAQANRIRRMKENIRAKARERSQRGPGFRGTRQKRKGLMPAWAEEVANLPDRFTGLSQTGQARHVIFARGWAVDTSGLVLRHDLPPVNLASGWRVPAPRSYALTEAGKVARAWLQWVRARRVLGWPCPMMGKSGVYVPLWIEGADIPIPKHMNAETAGYFPGDAADEAWPGFTGSLETMKSVVSGIVVSRTPG